MRKISHGQQQLLFLAYKGHYQEYNSDSETFGSLVGNPEVFYNYCKNAIEHGYCVDSHAIGDRGISEVIDVLNMEIIMTIVNGKIVFEK